MKKLDDNNFLDWIKDETAPTSYDEAFVLITGKTCPKCKKLKEDLTTISHPDFPEYCFSGNNKDIAASLKEYEVSEVPTFLVKVTIQYKKFHKNLILKYDPPKDISDLENIFDALKQKDLSFFGYDEYGRDISEHVEGDELFANLIRTITGKLLDYSIQKEFEDAIAN